MRWWTASSLVLATLACVVATPAPAKAATPSTPSVTTSAEAPPPQVRRKRPRVRALELQALGMTQLLPRPGVGGDLAFAFGHPNFQVRVGAMVVGVPAFQLGAGAVANLLQVGTLDVCAAKRVLHHQIRMCMGGQAGGMAHLWKGFENPGRPMTVWAAGTLKGDYQIFLTKRLGIIGGVGMVIPLAGPTFGGTDQYGSRAPVVFPGPIAGFLSLGTSVRW